jgi:predicted acyl esterase
LCDVDGRGRSRDLTDQIIRLGPTGPADGGTRSVSLPLTGVSHVFLPGHRIRLQVSGGAFPRYARNLGTAGDPITSTRSVPVGYRVFHSGARPSAITMPVLAPGGEAREGSIGDGDGNRTRETSL